MGKSMNDGGVIYILTNPVMPGLVKIGCTTGPVEDRVKDLSSATGVPVAFACHFAARVSNMLAKEKLLHQLFDDHRINPKREFFKIAPEKVVIALRLGDLVEVTPGKTDLPPEEAAAADKAEKADVIRRSRIDLAAIGIPMGAQLTLSRGNDIHAIVVAGNKVEYDNQVMSLSAAALAAIQKLGYAWSAVSGSDFWLYEGKTLDEIRTAKEAEQFGSSREGGDG